MSGNLAVSSINGVDISVSPVATQAFANSLLAEYTVSGSAVTSIDFSGLDINTHKSYRVELEIYNSSGTDLLLYSFVNNNTTLTNYSSQALNANSTTISVASANTPRCFFVVQGTKGACSLNILKSGDRSIIINSGSNYFQTNADLTLNNTINVSLFTITNITQLTFTSSVASAIGIGSKIRIYRGDV